MVINGTGVIGGNRADDPARAIRRYDRGTGGPSLSWTQEGLTVWGTAPGGTATVWLVRYDLRTLEGSVRAGENAGHRLPRCNIVKQLTRLGHWTGGSESIPLPPATDPVLKSAVLVQHGPSGPILAAARMP